MLRACLQPQYGFSRGAAGSLASVNPEPRRRAETQDGVIFKNAT
jgi:hypothetical protein